MNDDILADTANAQRQQFVEDFSNYGFLLNTMTPQEFAVEIGKVFPVPKQAAIVAVLLLRIYKLEHEHGE